ncbi:MAG: haloacid dehalogenase type II [Chthoniobacterales bacterium]
MGETRVSSVKAIVFDIFGTLVDWRGSLVTQLSAFGRERGLDADWTVLVDAWRSAYQPSLDAVRRRAVPWTVLDELHRASLIALLPDFGLSSLSDQEIDFFVAGWHRLNPWPDVVPGLQRLRQRYIIGPLSNANLSLMVNLAKFARLPWDVVFGSDLFRHYKPDPETYLGVCDLLRLKPEQVMLVAAHNYDLKAAQALGLLTAFIPRPQEYGPHQTTDLQPEGDWNIVASDVEDLAVQI